MKIAFLATDMVEQVELTEPCAVEEQGWTPELVSLRSGKIQGFEHYDKADTSDPSGISVRWAPADADAHLSQEGRWRTGLEPATTGTTTRGSTN